MLLWLKSHCGLGPGHANAIILYLQSLELAKKQRREDELGEKIKKIVRPSSNSHDFSDKNKTLRGSPIFLILLQK
ncbi:MAG: hypothetical protein AUI50_06310 [Crenarchaeota archaeon 13_1_40CM_2_52_14]|nr:MAG: hypothetical protein AUI50_06310 [Crenarchaeota archaeon 13_1_40CM_2_52_14]OLE68281.1 MAG: hypothetical protein AUF78_17025 [archaeon 13_1_20CM_2_51_12]